MEVGNDRYAVVDGQLVRRIMGGEIEPPPAPPAINAAQQLEIERLKAKVAFPLADLDVLNLISGTPEQMQEAARKMHEQAVKANAVPPPAPAPAPAPVVPTDAPPTGGGLVPVPGGGNVAPPEHVQAARYEELKFKVENKIATEFERTEFFMDALRGGWNRHVGKMAARPGRD